jgi:hypothetical protein
MEFHFLLLWVNYQYLSNKWLDFLTVVIDHHLKRTRLKGSQEREIISFKFRINLFFNPLRLFISIENNQYLYCFFSKKYTLPWFHIATFLWIFTADPHQPCLTTLYSCNWRNRSTRFLILKTTGRHLSFPCKK